jgi:hypothetical protein
MNKKDVVIVALVTLCLTATLFLIVPIRSQTSGTYDPWKDSNDDGKINILDAIGLAGAFGTTGDPTKNVTVTNTIPSISKATYVYSAPFIVSYTIPPHPSPYGVGPGVYETDILVHNPSYYNVTIKKKIVVALPEYSHEFIPPIWLENGSAIHFLSDQAFRIDSTEISQYTQPSPGNVTKGFVVIYCNSPYLDVVAFYTVSEVNKDYTPGNTTSITSLTIKPQPYQQYIPDYSIP